MGNFIFILSILPFPCLTLYVICNRLIELIQQKRADDMRKAYQARKEIVEHQAR